jgi:hypothetical protein
MVDLMPQPKREKPKPKPYIRPMMKASSSLIIVLIYVGSTALLAMIIAIILYSTGVL